MMLLLSSAVHSADFSKKCSSWLSKSQIHTINRAYQLGVDHDLGYTLAAISFLESSAGQKLRNDRTKDYGVFGINLRTVKNRIHQLTGFEVDEWNKQRENNLIQHLMFDMESNAMYAVMELRFWQRVHGQNNWKLVWASYNGGYSYHRNEPMNYANKIAATIIKMKKLNCLE